MRHRGERRGRCVRRAWDRCAISRALSRLHPVRSSKRDGLTPRSATMFPVLIGIRLTPSSFGKQFSVRADFTKHGNHSFSFQVPFPSPHTCPRRTTAGRNGVRSAAASRTRSATHLDSELPWPTGTSGFGRTSSATGPLLFSKSRLGNQRTV